MTHVCHYLIRLKIGWDHNLWLRFHLASIHLGKRTDNYIVNVITDGLKVKSNCLNLPGIRKNLNAGSCLPMFAFTL